MDSKFIEERRLAQVQKRVKTIKGFYTHFAIYIIVNLTLLAMKWFSVEDTKEFFDFNRTFSTAFFWGIGLVFHAVGVFGPNLFLGRNWEQRKINELMKKEQYKKEKWE